MSRAVALGAALGLALALAGCARLPAAAPEAQRRSVWRGEVRIAEDLVLPRGSELVLEPGTVVRFAFRDDDGDGWGDVSLRVEGALIALGTPERPVVFTSEVEPAEPGAWGEIRIDFGSFHLAHAVVEGSTRGLHSHFSQGRVEDSVFRRNVDGTRFGESTVEVLGCLFYDHPGKALNARQCRNRVEGNLFRGNRNGIFLFESDGGSSFAGNVFRENDHPLRLGDFFQGTVVARGNDWGGAPPPEQGEDEGARVVLEPGPTGDAGPRGWPHWGELWKVELGGFVDAPPVAADEGVYAASWTGEVARLGFLDGARLASARLPDAVDAPPALGPGVLAVPCWDRSVYLLRRGDLAVLDSFAEEPSPADDHRQSGPVFVGSTLVVATWAGFVRAFETAGGRLEPRWSFQAGGPFRADLRAVGGGLVLAPCQDGTLYALDAATGRRVWAYSAGAPLLSAPAVEPGAAYLADRAGTLHAVELGSGKRLWTTPLGGGAWYAPPLLVEGTLYQGEDSGRLWAVDASTGAPRWTRALGAGIRARAAQIEPDLLVAPTAGGRLVLLDRGTGLERDALSLPEPLLSSPEVLGDRVLVGGRDGTLRALTVRTLPSPPEAPAGATRGAAPGRQRE